MTHIAPMYDDFIAKLYDTFSKAPKPALDDITSHRCLECDETRDMLHPCKNNEVPDNTVKYLNSSLSLLTPKALRYYLPRFIEYGLKNQDSPVFELTLYQLSPDEIDDYYEPRISIFSDPEKQMLVEYLKLYRETLDEVEAEIFEEDIQRGLKIWSGQT